MLCTDSRYRGLASALIALLMLLAPFASTEAEAAARALETLRLEVSSCDSDGCCDALGDEGESESHGAADHRGDCDDCGDACTHSCSCCVTAVAPAPASTDSRAEALTQRPGSIVPITYAAADPLPFDRPPR